MINISRREFLSSLLVTGLIYIADNKVESNFVYTLDEKTTFLKIYHTWKQKGLGDPLTYITNRSKELGITENLNASSIKSVSKQDFCDGFLFDVDGLLLSRFEAAVMAYHGKRLV